MLIAIHVSLLYVEMFSRGEAAPCDKWITPNVKKF